MKFFGIEHNKKTKHIIYYVFGIKISKKNKLEILKTKNEYLINTINQIGADKIPPASGELRQWQLELLDLMKDFDKVCRENGVQYWLDFGTLLGAIRHKGFIPWDDDIDTSMMKSDLDKLLPILSDYYKDTDFLVRKRAITCNNFQIRIRHKKYNLGIDIFPVYEYPENNLTKELEKTITEKIIYTRDILDKKYSGKKLSQQKISEAEQDIIKLQNQIILPQDKLIPEHPILFHGIDFPYEEGYYVMPNDMIFPLKKCTFEGMEFYIPNKSEEYLLRLWKNWKHIPQNINFINEHYFENYKNSEFTYYEDK